MDVNQEDDEVQQDISEGTAAKKNGTQSDSTDPLKNGNYQQFIEKRWARVQPHYDLNYLKFFENTLKSGDDWGSSTSYDQTQLGAVTWTSIEKSRFYDVLSRKGRHDLPGISFFIGTKSQLEVKGYLDFLGQEEQDQWLFEENFTFVTHAEVPAAIEISPDCEKVLDLAADALVALQEQYDNVLGRPTPGLPWFIDGPTALKLEKQCQSVKDDATVSGDQNSTRPSEISSFFHLAEFLHLSEVFFMNKGPQGQHQPWYEIREDGQTPAITSGAIEDFYNIIVNLIRKLVQTCLYLAQSRIRMSQADHKIPVLAITEADVLLAIDLMDLKKNSWEYWTTVARRNHVLVREYTNREISQKTDFISYEKAENFLRSSRKRRGDSNRFVTGYLPSDDESNPENSSRREDLDHENDTVESVRSGSQDLALSDDDSEIGNQSDGQDIESNLSRTSLILLDDMTSSKVNRDGEFEMKEDELMEELDQRARINEEAKLHRLFQLDSTESIDDERPSEMTNSLKDLESLLKTDFDGQELMRQNGRDMESLCLGIALRLYQDLTKDVRSQPIFDLSIRK